MKPEEAIEVLNEILDVLGYAHYSNSREYIAINCAIQAIEKQRINERSKVLKWHKCTRKNGSEFLKLIYYSPYLDGYTELGRFNMTKFEAQNNEWTLAEIMKELE